MDIRIAGQKSPPWQLEYAWIILDIVRDSDRAAAKSPAVADLDDSVESTTGNVVNVLIEKGNTNEFLRQIITKLLELVRYHTIHMPMNACGPV